MTTLYQKTANISACMFYEYQGSRQFCDISANWATLTGATAVARNVLECAAKCQILDQDTGCNAFKYYNETLSCEMAQVDTSASKSSIRRFVITEKASTRAFSWLKAPTSAYI